MKPHHFDRCWLRVSFCFASLFVGVSHAQPLDPLDFASLGTLNLSAGDYTIDTDTLTIFDNAAPGVPLFIGVADDQNGTADYFGGNWVPGTQGIPEIAVFTFDAIDLSPTASVTITGARAIALLSQGDATIGTTLSVNGQAGARDVSSAGADPAISFNLPGGPGGPGGFAGGGLVDPRDAELEPGQSFRRVMTLDGEGPGGGARQLRDKSPNSGAFGGDGLGIDNVGSSELASAYGDLSVALQGGSGGGSVNGDLFSSRLAEASAGGGGGGAIELGATGVLTIDANINAMGGGVPLLADRLGGGAGGGIRIDAGQLLINGTLNAAGGDSAGSVGAGGRIFVGGLSGEPFVYTAGQNDTDLTFDDFADFVVRPGEGRGFETIDNFGVITLRPGLALVPDAQVLQYGQTTQLRTSNLKLDLVFGDARVLSGGTLDVGDGVTTRATAAIELAGPTARIAGAGTLLNDGVLTGTGRIEVVLTNAAGGEVNAVSDTLTFTQAVNNNTGASINAIGSTLSFDDGLNSDGEINLINSTVNGDVANNGVVSLAGTNTFTGTVSGSGTFTGSGTGAFAGVLSPGNSPGLLAFEGDLELKPTATLEIEIAGTTPGIEHDRIEVGSFAALEGALDVTLLDGFVPELGDRFAFLFASGAFDASFAAINLPDLSVEGLAWELNPGGSTLFLEAVPALDGDYNLDGAVNAADYTVWRDGLGTMFTPGDYDVWVANFGATAPASSVAVPEPTAGVLLLLAVCLRSSSRRPYTGR